MNINAKSLAVFKTVTIQALCWIVFLFDAGAQNSPTWGISYAPTISKVDDFGKKEKNHRLGQQVCLQLQWRPTTHLDFQVGAGYSYLQGKYAQDIFTVDETLNTWVRHHDILLPVQIKLSFSERPNTFFFTTGIMPTLNIGRKVTQTRTSPYTSSGFEQDITRQQAYKWVDCFVSLGLGYEFQVKNAGRFFVQPIGRTNLLTVLAYFPKVIFGKRSDIEEVPPLVSTIGVELGYFIR